MTAAPLTPIATLRPLPAALPILILAPLTPRLSTLVQVTERALEKLTSDMKPTLVFVRKRMHDEDAGVDYPYTGTRELMLEAAIIPRDGSEWHPSPADERLCGTSARGQHQEFLVVLTADEEQRRRLPGFVHSAKFRFRLHYQFEQIPTGHIVSSDEIKTHVARILRWPDADALILAERLQAEHKRRFVIQNCGDMLQCDDEEGYPSDEQLDGYEPLSEAFLSQKRVKCVQEGLATERKAFIPFDLSVEERQGHQSLDDARNAIALTAACSIYVEESDLRHKTRGRLEAWILDRDVFTARSDGIRWQAVVWRGKRIQPPQGVSSDKLFYHVTIGPHPRWPVSLDRPPVRVRLPDVWLSDHAKAVEKACSWPWLRRTDLETLYLETKAAYTLV